MIDTYQDELKKTMFEKSFELLSLEYTMLNNELDKFHKMQNQNVVQATLVIGALLLYIGTNWSQASDLLCITMLLILPLACYAFLLASLGLLCRNRIIRKSMVDAESKYEVLLKDSSLSCKPLKHITEYLQSTKKPNAIVMRLDAGSSFAIMLGLPVVSVLACINKYVSAINPIMLYTCIALVASASLFTIRFVFMAKKFIADLK